MSLINIFNTILLSARQNSKVLDGVSILKKHLIRHPATKPEFFLNLSTTCNYNCIFCNRSIPKQVIRLDEIHKFDEIVANAKMVDITGYGEISIHPDFCKLIEKFSENNVPLRFVTNGSMLKKGIVERIVRSKIKEMVISVNSLNETTYKLIHGKNANLANVRENIDYLLSRSPDFPIHFSFVINSYNIHEIEDFIHFAKARAASINCLGLTPTLQEMYPKNIVVEDTMENRMHLDRMRKLAMRENVKARICYLENQRTEDKEIDPKRLRRIIQSCDWVYRKFFIEPDGSVRPCCWSREYLGDIRSSSFKDIWYGERFNRLRKAIKSGNSPSCKNCRRVM